MPKFKDNHDVDSLVDSWISVNRKEDPAEWKAWYEWRRASLGSFTEPDNFTVPTPFPPTTQAAAKAYVEAVRQLRKSIGWNTTRARLNDDVRAWWADA